jgi:hypothetical protein
LHPLVHTATLLPFRFRATEAKTRNNDPKAMRGRMSAMQKGEDDGKFDE